jgi:hypothetical protein
MTSNISKLVLTEIITYILVLIISVSIIIERRLARSFTWIFINILCTLHIIGASYQISNNYNTNSLQIIKIFDIGSLALLLPPLINYLQQM